MAQLITGQVAFQTNDEGETQGFVKNPALGISPAATQLRKEVRGVNHFFRRVDSRQ